MTEAEWLASEDPVSMIEALEKRGSDRKFSLFAIAGCYRCRPRPRKPKRKFEVVVQYVDGLAERDQVLKDWGPAGTSWPERPYRWARQFAIDSQNEESDYPPVAELVPLLHDIFGNPFREVKFDKRWRTTDVMLLAQGIYAEQAFDRMPILADALQDAGCTDDEILNHCRDTNQIHVRGCWVLDLILGKT